MTTTALLLCYCSYAVLEPEWWTAWNDYIAVGPYTHWNTQPYLLTWSHIANPLHKELVKSRSDWRHYYQHFRYNYRWTGGLFTTLVDFIGHLSLYERHCEHFLEMVCINMLCIIVYVNKYSLICWNEYIAVYTLKHTTTLLTWSHMANPLLKDLMKSRSDWRNYYQNFRYNYRWKGGLFTSWLILSDIYRYMNDIVNFF